MKVRPGPKYALVATLALVAGYGAVRSVVAARVPSSMHVVFVGAHRCHTQPCGCSLGGQLGGTEAQRKLYGDLGKKTASLLAIWGGTTFRCATDITPDEGPEQTADAARSLPVAVMALSVDDLQVGIDRLRSLRAKSSKPWVLSNATLPSGSAPWAAFADVTRDGAKFRVFSVTSMPPATVAAGAFSGAVVAEPVAALTPLLEASPPGVVNVVVVSATQVALVQSVAALPKAHLILDAEEANRETDAALLAGNRLQASLRGNGQAALVLSLWPEPTFDGFYSEVTGTSHRTALAFQGPGAVVGKALKKRPGLWLFSSEIRLLSR